MAKRLLIALPCLALILLAGFWSPPPDATRYDSERWIDSGLEKERHGNYAAAEHDLLAAAQIDRLFQPSWTLAGFYFRRQDKGNFWIWAGRALAVAQRDAGALFDLCWQTTDDPSEVWARVMPGQKSVWFEYLFYLTATGRWPAAASTGARIAAVATPGDQGPLMNYCDMALEHGDRAGGMAVWQALCRRGLLPFTPGRLLMNSEFRTAASGRGFDWRSPVNAGIGVVFRDGQADFTLSGEESERLVLLQQVLALDPLKIYRLEFDCKTGPTTGAAGIHWEAGAARSDGFAAPEWTRAQFEFKGDASALLLVYQRLPGSTTAEGTISIRHLEVLPE